MRVHPQKQRPANASLQPMITDRLADRQDVRLIETSILGTTPMPRRPERDLLLPVGNLRPLSVILRHQPRNVRQHLHRDRLARQFVNLHLNYPPAVCTAHPMMTHPPPPLKAPNLRALRYARNKNATTEHTEHTEHTEDTEMRRRGWILE